MKKIKSFVLDTTVVSGAQGFVGYVVTGDPGSVFSAVITNEDNNFYNFPENTIVSLEENVLTPAGSFSSTPAKLSQQAIDKSGVYYGTIHLPAVTDDDKYSIVVYAEAYFNTTFDKNISNGLVYFLEINQIIDASLTFSLSSTANSGDYNTLPSNVVAAGTSSKVSGSYSNRQFSISWPVTLSDDDLLTHFVIAKQLSSKDFYISTTKDTLNAGSGTSLELKDISKLSEGMVVSGTGIASGATIVSIIPGYKDINKSTAENHVYVVPKSITDNTISDSTGGTVVVSASSTFVADRTITFKGYGRSSFENFNSTVVEMKNLKLVIDPVVTTTDAAVSNSATIPLTSTKGIKVAETVLMTGIGVTTASPHVDAISNGVNVTVSAAQTIENGQTITFTGSSRSATITADVAVKKFGKENLTLTLELDNILTVA